MASAFDKYQSKNTSFITMNQPHSGFPTNREPAHIREN
jgi:hypothetical protein